VPAPRLILSVTNDLVIDQRVHRMACSLLDLGYDVWVVGRLKPTSEPLSHRPYACVRLRCWFTRGPLFYLEFTLRLWAWLLRNKAHTYVANDLDTLLPNTLVARWYNARLVVDAHELFTEVPEVVRRPAIRRAWLGLEQWMLPDVDALLTVSPGLQAAYFSRYSLHATLVRNLPLPKPPPTAEVIQKRGQRLLYQGVLKAGRGLELMVRVMPHLPQAELWLVGGGPWEDRLRVLAEQLGVPERVRITGYLPLEQLAAYTPQARIGLSWEEPKATNTRLSSPNKLYDYLQARVPVCVANLPVHREVVEAYEVGTVLESREPEAVAEQLCRMLTNEMAYKSWVANCERAAAELNWDHERTQLERVYGRAQAHG